MGILFALLTILTVFLAIGMVFLGQNPVHTAMFLVGVMVCLAVHFLLLGFEFLAFAQLVIYAGAIMVLFLFMIMLLNLRQPDRVADGLFSRKLGGLLVAVVLWFLLHLVGIAPVADAPARAYGVLGETTRPLAQALLTRYLLPFELTAILLLVAIVGALVMGRRELNYPATPTGGDE